MDKFNRNEVYWEVDEGSGCLDVFYEGEHIAQINFQDYAINSAEEYVEERSKN
jgi:hypothetical protein